jgi:hypothetical protein
LDQEAAVSEGKSATIGSHDGWKNLLLLGVVLGTAVNEAVFFPGVAMEVAIEQEFPLFLHSLDHLLGVIDSGVRLSTGLDPLPIQIN